MAVVDLDPSASRAFKRRLDLVMWMPAWDAYAIAGAVLKQFNYKNAHLHKVIVLENAMQAQKDGRSALVGVLYDEFVRYHLTFCDFCFHACMSLCCRQDWDEQSARLGERFRISEHIGVYSASAMRRAEKQHDQWFGVPTPVCML